MANIERWGGIRVPAQLKQKLVLWLAPQSAKPRARDSTSVMSSAAANEDDASNPRAKVSELSEKVVDTNPYSRLMCAGRHRHACCAAD